MLSVALCIADIDRGAAVHFDPHERQRVRRAHFFMRLRARGHPQVVGKAGRWREA